jgi:hypothetical protein
MGRFKGKTKGGAPLRSRFGLYKAGPLAYLLGEPFSKKRV